MPRTHSSLNCTAAFAMLLVSSSLAADQNDSATAERKQEQADLTTRPAPTEASVTILSPRHYQVFQRESRTEGTILVNGCTSLAASRAECRITGRSLNGDVMGKWQPLPYDRAAKSFNAKLPLPAGGWYDLQVRVHADHHLPQTATVEKFGIGEVFVGAGQSNSTNCGEERIQQTTGMVASFGGLHWKLADDPQLGVADKSEGGSFWPAFGDAMYDRFGVPIGVATTGYGGTSVNQWQPDTHLFNWMMTRVHQLGPLGFRALLWHQGESDTEMSADEYFAKLKSTIAASRQNAGWQIPWFVAQTSYHDPKNLRFENVRSAQQRIWDDGVALRGPDTDVLTGDHRDMDGLGIHFSPKGLKAHGRMWAEIVAPFVERQFD